MTIFDKLKIKKEKSKEALPAKPKSEKSAATVSSKTTKTADPGALLVLKAPHVSEKATDLTEDNFYVFRVASDANKLQIKSAVEEVYGVKVLEVRTVNIKGKTRRLGRTIGKTNAVKKAMVKLAPGQSIELMPK